jgi:hypothetical protein
MESMPVIPVLGQDCEFQASLGYTVRASLKKLKQKKESRDVNIFI